MSNTAELKQLLKTTTSLNLEQAQKFFAATPANKIKERPAKGGGKWKYVSGSYVTQVLNSLFGFNWSFEVTTSMQEALTTAQTGTIVVQGRLKVKIGDEWIVKEQYGRKEVAFKKDPETQLPTKTPLDFGNDMKSAATDAKKKCASELGLFADVYSQEDFLEVKLVEAGDTEDTIKKFQDAKTPENIETVLSSLKPEQQKAFAQVAKNRLKEIRDAENK